MHDRTMFLLVQNCLNHRDWLRMPLPHTQCVSDRYRCSAAAPMACSARGRSAIEEQDFGASLSSLRFYSENLLQQTPAKDSLGLLPRCRKQCPMAPRESVPLGESQEQMRGHMMGY